MADTDKLHFVIADDHPLFRGALIHSLEPDFQHVSFSEASTLDEAMEFLEQGGVDLVLLDLSMPGMRGFSGLMLIAARFSELPVAVVSGHEDPSIIRRSLDLGALAFIPKSSSADQIKEAIHKVLKGEKWTAPGIEIEENDKDRQIAKRLASLTPRQIRVLIMLGEGLLNKQIAYLLSVSEATVKAHVSAILQKLGVDSRTQAVIVANQVEAGQWQKLDEPKD